MVVVVVVVGVWQGAYQFQRSSVQTRSPGGSSSYAPVVGVVVCGLLLWEDTKKLRRKRNMKTAHFWANQKTHQVLFYVCQQRQLRKVKHEDKTVSSYYFL